MVSRESVELIFASLRPEAEADEALEHLIEMNRSGTIELISAMALAKDEQGSLDIQDASDVLEPESPFEDVLADKPGGLFARIEGILAGFAAHAVLGLSSRPLAKVGVEDRHLRSLAQELAPGTSALLALVEEEAVSQVFREMRPLVSDFRRFVLESEEPDRPAGTGSGG